MTLSPDGRSLYVASRGSAAVAVFARDPSTGLLSETGCVSAKAGERCTPARGLLGARGVTVSPDGRTVYAGAFSDNAVTTFSRAADGSLAQLPGVLGCVHAGPATTSCGHGRALGHAWPVAVSPDGRFAYSGVGDDGNSGLAVFARG